MDKPERLLFPGDPVIYTHPINGGVGEKCWHITKLISLNNTDYSSLLWVTLRDYPQVIITTECPRDGNIYQCYAHELDRIENYSRQPS